ncbi:hypothetical protein E2C01_085777 [Portunus trituberculatus]|uniref:Uncharacterized protein n=1 Tax=Portunus trituberculatus TaxID=210409 RepID=A0A5B7JBL0_PORTR|nr:hypothetical protein [Portunus trituberculatus]
MVPVPYSVKSNEHTRSGSPTPNEQQAPVFRQKQPRIFLPCKSKRNSTMSTRREGSGGGAHPPHKQ